MRTSTKVIAVLLILMSLYGLIASAITFKRFIPIVGINAMINLTTIGLPLLVGIIVGAIALLVRRKFGWWMLLFIMGLQGLINFAVIISAIVHSISVPYYSPFPTAIYEIGAILLLAVLFILLLKDPPSRWVREFQDVEG